MTEVTLDSGLLGRLARRNNFEAVPGRLVFFGLRGLLPLDISGTSFAPAHPVRPADVNHMYMRCTLGQLDTKEGQLAVFPGSTVPHLKYISAAIGKRGVGANMLMLGHFQYQRGGHRTDKPGGHRAFRQAIFFPVWRTSDDRDYDLDDAIDNDGGFVFDNLHCAYNDSLDVPEFGSAGCQVVAGRQERPAGKKNESGPWRRFLENAYEAKPKQARYSYFLFSGAEVLAVAMKADRDIRQSVRFGSVGDLVVQVQKALMDEGYPLQKADGDFGQNTLQALMGFQTKSFGPGTADGVVGPNTASALGVTLPSLG